VATKRAGSEESTIAALETLCWVCRQYKRLTGEHHTFAPTAGVGKEFGVELDPTDKEMIADLRTRGLFNKKALLDRSSFIMVSLNTQLTKHQSSEDPNTASPSRPPRINVTVKSPNRSWTFGYFEYYAARRIIDMIVQDRAVKWIDDNTMKVTSASSEAVITTDITPDGLSSIMEHEFNERERRWMPDNERMRQAINFFSPQQIAKEYGGEDAARDTKQTAAKPDKPAKAERAPKQERPKAERPSGLIPLPTLLEDTDIDAKEARTALRKMGTEKPAHGRWEFTAAEAKAIKPKIVAQVKKMRK
jgi:hypothetical protein